MLNCRGWGGVGWGGGGGGLIKWTWGKKSGNDQKWMEKGSVVPGRPNMVWFSESRVLNRFYRFQYLVSKTEYGYGP